MSFITKWFVKTYRCRNGVEEKTKFPVTFRSEMGRREQKRAAQRESKRTAGGQHILARALNENFEPGRDLHLVLEFSAEGLAALMKRAARYADEELRDRVLRAAMQELENFIRRVQRVTGSEALRYIGLASDLAEDTRTGEMRPARIHIHFIANAEALDAVREKWTSGAVMEQELYNVKGDLHALAEYLLRQTRSLPGLHRYRPSRNLAKAAESAPVLVTRGEESNMRVPRGCVELYHSQYERGRPQYMRYLRPKTS